MKPGLVTFVKLHLDLVAWSGDFDLVSIAISAFESGSMNCSETFDSCLFSLPLSF